MPRYAIIRSTLVVNVVDASAAWIAAHEPSAVESDTASPGDTYTGGQFVRPEPVERVPNLVSMYQFAQALEDVLSITEDDVDAAIAGMPAGRPKRRIRCWWRTATQVRRQGAITDDLQALMSITNPQLRQVFIAAESVSE